MELLETSALALARAIAKGELSAREVALAHLARIDTCEPHLHAFRHVAAEQALAAADHVDAQRSRGEPLGPLAGVPIGLKDIFVTQGLPTTCGSKILAEWRPPYASTHARRLAAAGAVVLGKLAMDEFAMGSSNENTPFEPVRNPWGCTPNPRGPWASDYVPGGSSGGSAAAVAARQCVLALGTDTGGSVRQPASLCNLVGLKPTYGRISRFGMVAFASSLDHCGTLSRCVADAALALQVLAGHDPLDASSLRDAVPDYLAATARASAGLVGTRIGVHADALRLPGLDAEVRRAFEQSLAVLRAAGAELVDIALPHFEHAVATYYVLCTAEASSNLARYDGTRFGLRVARDSLLDTYAATRHAGFGAEVARRILLGTFVLRADSYDRYYGRAMKVRTLIARDYAAAFERCDAIASPTSPLPGFRLGDKLDDPLAMYLSDVFTIGANLAGLPAISIPAGFSTPSETRPRLPIGLHLIAPRLAEPELLRIAAVHEAATPWHREVPPCP